MKSIILSVITMLLAHITLSQNVESDKVNKEFISKIGFIVGNWKGEGWSLGRDGQKHNFTQTETISFKLDSTVILVEGLGMDKGNIIHNAMAIISYDKKDSSYVFHSYLSNGKGGKFKAELLDNKLYWYPNENMRYIIYINDKGQWYETGEMKREENWFQFFEMTLDKQ